MFFDIVHAGKVIGAWPAAYNTARPHSPLGYRTLASYADQPTAAHCAASSNGSTPSYLFGLLSARNYLQTVTGLQLASPDTWPQPIPVVPFISPIHVAPVVALRQRMSDMPSLKSPVPTTLQLASLI
jgi:hypothetical protein